MIQILSRRVDWRESPALWGPVAWAASLLWPGAVAGLLMLPPTRPEGRVVLVALLVAGVGVGAILRLIEWERKRDGTPRTRLGVLGRFLFFGFLFSVLASILAVLIQAILALVGPHGLSQNLAEATSALALGFGVVVASALIGVSWSLWAGLVAGFIAFVPRVESSRPRSFSLQSLGDAEPAVSAPSRSPRTGARGEVEAVVRPDGT